MKAKISGLLARGTKPLVVGDAPVFKDRVY